MPMQPARTSNYLNMEVWVYSETGSWNITDDVTAFQFHNSRNFMHQKINLELEMHSSKMKSTAIGFFKEKYVILIELFDASQNKVIDKILFDTMVIKYNGLNVSDINKDFRPDNHKYFKFNIDLLNTYEEKSFEVVNKVFHDTTYKKVMGWIHGEFRKRGVFKKEYDTCKVPFPPKFEQFFIPTMQLYNTLPYMLWIGYTGPTDVVTSYFTNEGYVIYRFSKSLSRKKIKTVIYPSRPQVQDFKEIFVTDFTVYRDPGIYLKWGRKNPIFEISEFKHRFHAPWNVDPRINNPVFIPHLYPSAGGRTFETDYDIRSNAAITSSFEKTRAVSMVKLYVTRWRKFEYLLPVRHPYLLKFTHKALNYLSGVYFVTESKITISRHENEFVPATELLCQMAKVS